MKSSDSIANLSDALVKANLVLTNPKKDRTVSTGRYSYAYVDLASILDDLRPILQTHGLAVVQEAAAAERGVGVTTRLIHTSGEWLEFDALVMPSGDAQATGSAITYARRYALCAALSIAADEDDDGAKASGAGQPTGGKDRPASASQSAGGTGKEPPAGSTSAVHLADEQAADQAGDGQGLPNGEEAASARPSGHVHEWAPSPNPKLTKILICTVTGCLETTRKGS